MKKGRKWRICPLHICSSQKITSPKTLLTPDYLDTEGLKEASILLKCDKYSLLGSLFLLPCNTGSPLKLALSSSAHAALPQMFPVLHLLAGHLVTLTQPCFLLMLFTNSGFILILFINIHEQNMPTNQLLCFYFKILSQHTAYITMNRKWNVWYGTGVDIAILRSYTGISFKTLRKPLNLSHSPLWDSNHKPSECMWLDLWQCC